MAGWAIVDRSSRVGVLSRFPMVSVGVNHFAEAGVPGETCSVHRPVCGWEEGRLKREGHTTRP